jgi:hypothetical protein
MGSGQWTERRREFSRKLEALMAEYSQELRLGTADDLEDDEPLVPPGAIMVGWLLPISWMDPENEESWTVVAHPEGMLYISRLGLGTAAIDAIG